MEIKEKIDEIVNKIKSDDNFSKEFFDDPAGTVERVTGIRLPNEEINKMIDGVRAKVTSDEVKEKVSGFMDKLGL